MGLNCRLSGLPAESGVAKSDVLLLSTSWGTTWVSALMSQIEPGTAILSHSTADNEVHLIQKWLFIVINQFMVILNSSHHET